MTEVAGAAAVTSGAGAGPGSLVVTEATWAALSLDHLSRGPECVALKR